MGNEFLDKIKGGCRKGWDRAKRKLSVVDIFRGTPEKIRTICVRPDDVTCFCDGDLYELRADSGSIQIYKDLRLIGTCTDPPKSVLNEIVSLGGQALGGFYRLREHSGLVDVAVCLDSKAKEQAA
jgi:hypothetical protein